MARQKRKKIGIKKKKKKKGIEPDGTAQAKSIPDGKKPLSFGGLASGITKQQPQVRKKQAGESRTLKAKEGRNYIEKTLQFLVQRSLPFVQDYHL